MKAIEVLVNGLLAVLVVLMAIILLSAASWPADGRSCADPNQQWPGKAQDCWGVAR